MLTDGEKKILTHLIEMASVKELVNSICTGLSDYDLAELREELTQDAIMEREANIRELINEMGEKNGE